MNFLFRVEVWIYEYINAGVHIILKAIFAAKCYLYFDKPKKIPDTYTVSKGSKFGLTYF